ncbi:MAG: sigma-70 family RNA polymerase sigma factor [Prochloron sp. SP5CPC1]|nr:sigma-70 family RNA polymerase sigma factor [Candidatus Paraprochloron terpiosi SP5CPC1]
MEIPRFPESKHPLVKSLLHEGDRSLLSLFQLYPEQGKYFTAIFCRYSAIVYTLIAHGTKSKVQGDYLFALTWRDIFYEMREISLPEGSNSKSYSWQNWLIDMTGLYIHHVELPPVSAINYNLKAAPPPLWCYLEQGLELIDPVLRLIIVMSDNFHWSETRIAAHFQAEGEMVSPAKVKQLLLKGHQMLNNSLPQDIKAIYLHY